MWRFKTIRVDPQIRIGPRTFTSEWNADVMPGTTARRADDTILIECDGELVCGFPWSRVVEFTIHSTKEAAPKSEAETTKKPPAKARAGKRKG